MPRKVVVPASPDPIPSLADLPIETVPLAALHPHPRNPVVHPEAQLAHIRHSLQEYGYYRNIVVAQDNTILAGHGVVEAARSLGWTEAPVRRMALAPDAPAAIRLVVGDNYQAQLRVQEDAVLAALLKELAALDIDALLGTGFDVDTLADLLGSLPPAPASPVQDPEVPIDRLAEVLDRWQVHEGDIWGCGDHRIVCMSCFDEATLPRLLTGRTPQMIFADPPYGVSIVATNVPVGGGEAYDIPFGGVKQPRRRGYVGGGQRQKDVTGHYPIETWGQPVRGTDGAAKPFGSKAVRGSVGATHVVGVGKYAPVVGDDSPATAIHAVTTFLAAFPSAVHIWWGGNYYADHLPASACWLVWDKDTTGNFADCELAWTNQDKAARLFHHRWNGMLRDSEHERRWHPTQKPAALAAWAYETLGQPGDAIFDPFLGSGPSLLAAEQCQRIVYGCEVSMEYISIILERWNLLTGRMPVLLDRA